MDDSRQDIITKLKFLSRVSKGQRINVKEMILQDESWLTTASEQFGILIIAIIL